MTMTIITQTEEIINFGNILKLTHMVGEYDGEQAYAIYAFPVSEAEVSEADLEERAIQLCISHSETAIKEVFDKIKKWLQNGTQPLLDISSMILED